MWSLAFTREDVSRSKIWQGRAVHTRQPSRRLLPPGFAILHAARNVLGADYNHRDYAVLAGCRIRSVHAAFFRYGGGSGSWGDCGDLPRAYATGIWHKCVSSWATLRRGTLGTKCISIWGDRTGDRGVIAAASSRMASRVSSFRRSVHRNWCGAGIGGAMARGRRQMITLRARSTKRQANVD